MVHKYDKSRIQVLSRPHRQEYYDTLRGTYTYQPNEWTRPVGKQNYYLDYKKDTWAGPMKESPGFSQRTQTSP